ncbi:MAG: RsmB/NOP family class I SAM-dependent RNA methyltransferase [Alphaproteobacteria bacterium]|nr:RsmB/NOP family class I SAM-dependent RNA methyltransferase [Alphaproteobacteria bacterium]
MQIAARYQAVFELISKVFEDKKPADVIINDYVRKRKYIGSKDRRFIVETVWDIIRHRMRLEFDAKSKDVRKVLLVYLKDEDFDIITGGQYGFAPLSSEEKKWLKNLSDEVYPEYVENECPKWLFEKINSLSMVQALNMSAPADLRVNMAERTMVKKRLESEGLFFTPTTYSPYGLRSSERVNLNNCIAYHEGLVDVQDESSQIAAILCDVSPDEKVIDYCAGAGGKSLAIAAINRNEGVIYAHDANFNRMDVIKDRALRLGIRNIKIVRILDDSSYDRFIIDAPCSGSGTLRRAPDSKFRLSAKHIEELNETQLEILETAYKSTKKGGYIVYMTCSVLQDENENIVSAFKQKHQDMVFVNHKNLWEEKIDTLYPCNSSDYVKLSPLVTNTDGFFFCMMKKSLK